MRLPYTSARTHSKLEMVGKFFVYYRLLIDNRLHKCIVQQHPEIWAMERWRQRSGNRATRHTLYIDDVSYLLGCEDMVHVYINIVI